MTKAKKKIFSDLRESLEEALAFERGEQVNLRVTKLPPKPPKFKPREIREIRRRLNATQPLFATYLNVHVNTVRSWEQGSRKPRAADLKLLAIAKSNPSALL
jgi:putative transcriptional regulator